MDQYGRFYTHCTVAMVDAQRNATIDSARIRNWYEGGFQVELVMAYLPSSVRCEVSCEEAARVYQTTAVPLPEIEAALFLDEIILERNEVTIDKDGVGMAGENDQYQYRIIETPPLSELQKFAAWFHQDYELLFSDFNEGAAQYLDDLPQNRKILLCHELSAFLLKNSNQPPNKMREIWRSLGAAAWPSDQEIAPALREFVKLLEAQIQNTRQP